MTGLHPNGKVVTGIDIPVCCIFKNCNLLPAHIFHALTRDGQSVGGLEVSVSKGRTVASLLDAKFSAIDGEGD